MWPWDTSSDRCRTRSGATAPTLSAAHGRRQSGVRGPPAAETADFRGFPARHRPGLRRWSRPHFYCRSMPPETRSFADARAPRLFDPAMIAAVRREEVVEAAPVEPAAPEDATGPQYWARARVSRPPVTRSRTGIQLSPYLFASDEQVGPPEMLKSLRLAAPGLIRTAHEILDLEGPMPMPRLITVLARRFGIPRLDPQRRYNVTRIVAPQFVVVDDFAWPTGTKPATWRGARRIGDPRDRRIVDISPEELQNAME